MTISPDPKWVLLVPFKTAPGFTIEASRTVEFAGYTAELRPGSLGYTNAVIGGLETEAAALNLFDSLRIGFLVASLNIRWGVRVQDQVLILNKDTPLPNEVDVPMIYQEGTNLSRLIISAGPIQMQFDKILPTIVASLEFGLMSESDRSQPQTTESGSRWSCTSIVTLSRPIQLDSSALSVYWKY